MPIETLRIISAPSGCFPAPSSTILGNTSTIPGATLRDAASDGPPSRFTLETNSKRPLIAIAGLHICINAVNP